MCNTLLDSQLVQDLSPPQDIQTGSGAQNPSIQWVIWNFSSGREVDHKLQSIAKVKNEWSYTSTALLARIETSIHLPFVPIYFLRKFILKNF
jgi:hypothetical protein